MVRDHLALRVQLHVVPSRGVVRLSHLVPVDKYGDGALDGHNTRHELQRRLVGRDVRPGVLYVLMCSPWQGTGVRRAQRGGQNLHDAVPKRQDDVEEQ